VGNRGRATIKDLTDAIGSIYSSGPTNGEEPANADATVGQQTNVDTPAGTPRVANSVNPSNSSSGSVSAGPPNATRTLECQLCQSDVREAFRTCIAEPVSDDAGVAILQNLQPHIANATMANYPTICYPHLRVLAGRSVGMKNSFPGLTFAILRSLMLEVTDTDNLPSYKSSKRAYFQCDRGGLQASDALRQGEPAPLPPVNVDAHFIYEILGKDASLNDLSKDGVTVANNLLSYLLDDPELKLAIEESLDCYHYHDGFQEASDHRGWMRNC
jgi:hypothetical protein